MQKELQKRPYLAPELTMVDFKVEVGQQASQEVQTPTGYWGATTDERQANMLLFQMQMDAQNGAYNETSYFGNPTTGNWGSAFWGN